MYNKLINNISYYTPKPLARIKPGVSFFMKKLIIHTIVIVFTLQSGGIASHLSTMSRELSADHTTTLRPIATAIAGKGDTIMLPMGASADDFFSSFYDKDGIDGFPVLRNNVPGKEKGQVVLRVCEISELSDSERPDIIEALMSWFGYGPRVIHQWRVDEIISDLIRAESLKGVPLNDDGRRTYIAISDPDVNGKYKIDIEGFVIVKEFDNDTWVACWEIKPDNRDEEHKPYGMPKTAEYAKSHERRFIGVGRQLLCYAVHRELKTRKEIGFDLTAEDELKAEGLRGNFIYEENDLADYIRRHIIKTHEILRAASVPDRSPKASSAGIKPSWIQKNMPQLHNKLLATICLEGYIPEFDGDAREANTKGGLGDHYGGKLEGLHAIGMRALGAMPLYSKRRVHSIQGGKQRINTKDVSYDTLLQKGILKYALGKDGKPLQLLVWGWDKDNTSLNRLYYVEVYCVDRGGTPLYMFYCPDVFDVLYPDRVSHGSNGRSHRYLQETILAKAVSQCFIALDMVPDILHLNEGHVAGIAGIIRSDSRFDATSIAYTNHTVVAAGLEKFSNLEIDGGDISRERYQLGFHEQRYLQVWPYFEYIDYEHRLTYIDLCKGAMELCQLANAVADEHEGVMRRDVFPGYTDKIRAVLNGTSDTWNIPEILDMTKRFESKKGVEFSDLSVDELRASLSFEEIAQIKNLLIDAHRKAKYVAHQEIKGRTRNTMTNRQGNIINAAGVDLGLEKPTVWLVRRMEYYKNQLPVLKDIVHVICADKNEEVNTIWGKMKGLGMQVVVGGIAGSAEDWIEEFVSWMEKPELRGRFVFVPDCDTTLLKMQAQGADICLNCPRQFMEACGTSGHRSAGNGGLNVAVATGGFPEFVTDGKNGFLVGPYKSEQEYDENVSRDILGKLARLSDTYYTKNQNSEWVDMMFESYLSYVTKLSASAMEKRYARRMYEPVLKIREVELSGRTSAVHGTAARQRIDAQIGAAA